MASVPDSGCALRLRRSPVISPAADLGHRGIVQSNHCDCIVRAGYSTEVGMGSQTAGYATDVPYARTFIRELAPALLDHVGHVMAGSHFVTAVALIRRSDAAACFARAASSPIRARYAGCHPADHEILQSEETCRRPARRRSAP